MDNIEFEPECKSRGMETGLHSRGAASVALEREFTKMIKEHRKTIYTVCYFFSKDADEVNDLFQEILINLWKGFPKFRGESSHRTWIWRVSLNSSLHLPCYSPAPAISLVILCPLPPLCPAGLPECSHRSTCFSWEGHAEGEAAWGELRACDLL